MDENNDNFEGEANESENNKPNTEENQDVDYSDVVLDEIERRAIRVEFAAEPK